MTQIVKIGIPSQEYLALNAANKTEIDKQPAGIQFFKRRWSTNHRGSVQIEHGKLRFKVDHALSVTGSEDSDKLALGVDDFVITAGLTDLKEIHHIEARDKIYSLLKSLVQLGWKRNLIYSDPRLTGREAFNYLLHENSVYSAPVDYRPNVEEWMELYSPEWSFYGDGVILDITFRRDGARMELDKPGGYLLVLKLYSFDQNARDYFEGDDRNRWKELWSEEIKRLKLQRYAKEQELIDRGFTIFTDYEDPIVHPDDPIEPDQ